MPVVLSPDQRPRFEDCIVSRTSLFLMNVAHERATLLDRHIGGQETRVAVGKCDNRAALVRAIGFGTYTKPEFFVGVLGGYPRHGMFGIYFDHNDGFA
jgi:hypothetical protein